MRDNAALMARVSAACSALCGARDKMALSVAWRRSEPLRSELRMFSEREGTDMINDAYRNAAVRIYKKER